MALKGKPISPRTDEFYKSAGTFHPQLIVNSKFGLFRKIYGGK